MRTFLLLVLLSVTAGGAWWWHGRYGAASAQPSPPSEPPPPPPVGPDAAADLRRGVALAARGDDTGAEPALRRAESLSEPGSETHREACRHLADLCDRAGRPRAAATWRISGSSGAGETEAAWGAIAQLNERLLGPSPSPEDVTYYTVVANDNLAKIARAHGTTTEAIQWLNAMGDRTEIRPGQRLKILAGRIRVEVGKTDLVLTVYADDRILKRYPVGLGAGDKTPEGDFEVTQRIPQPPWYPPHAPQGIPYGHPDNVLGDYWLKIEGAPEYQGYGIHGTTQPETIGQRVSNGCVRMRNEDVREVFAFCPLHTPVRLRP